MAAWTAKHGKVATRAAERAAGRAAKKAAVEEAKAAAAAEQARLLKPVELSTDPTVQAYVAAAQELVEHLLRCPALDCVETDLLRAFGHDTSKLRRMGSDELALAKERIDLLIMFWGADAFDGGELLKISMVELYGVDTPVKMVGRQAPWDPWLGDACEKPPGIAI